MSDTPETSRGAAEKAPRPTLEQLGKLIDQAQAAVQADCVEVGRKVEALAQTATRQKEALGEIEKDTRDVLEAVERRGRLAEDAVKGLGVDLRDALHPGPWQPVTTVLVALSLAALVALFVKMPQSQAVADDVTAALQKNDDKGKNPPGVNPKEIADIHRKVDAITDWIQKTKFSTRDDLKAGVDALRLEIARNNPAPSAGGLDKKVEALEKALADLPTRVRNEVVPRVDEAVQKGQNAKAIDQKLTQLTADVKGALAEQGKRLDAMEARLGAALRLPKDDALVPVLFVLECGGRMLDLNHEAARASLLRALEETVRVTPARPFGLLLARGKDAARQLRLNKHDPAEVAELVARQEPLVPIAANEVAWERACGQAIDDVLLRAEPRKRVVYVTCSPPTEAKFDAGKLAAQAAPKGVEVWVIHLLRGGGDGPSRDLATLATETGGAYLVVPSPREESPRQKQAARRLEAALFDALDLRAPDAANK